MAIDPHTFFDFLKRTTPFFRYVELDKEAHEAADLVEDGGLETRQFGEMFNPLSFRVDDGQIQSVFQLGKKEARLAIELSYVLAYHYMTALGFNAIRLPADPAGRYGALSTEDYFITPSYVPEADLHKRESLLRAEKESSSNKPLLYPRKLVISENQLFNHVSFIVNGTFVRL